MSSALEFTNAGLPTFLKCILIQWIYLYLYLLFYVAFNSQGHIAMGSLQVEETSAYCTENHRASESNYQLSNMKRPARDSKVRTLTATPPSPLLIQWKREHRLESKRGKFRIHRCRQFHQSPETKKKWSVNKKKQKYFYCIRVSAQ